MRTMLIVHGHGKRHSGGGGVERGGGGLELE